MSATTARRHHVSGRTVFGNATELSFIFFFSFLSLFLIGKNNMIRFPPGHKDFAVPFSVSEVPLCFERPGFHSRASRSLRT